MEEEVIFWGHPNVRCLHHTTLEITTEKNLTPNGDCIVGVSASKGCGQLHPSIKRSLRKENSIVRLTIIVEPYSVDILGESNSKLILSHQHDIVVRKSNYIDARTLAINCDLASLDLPRPMIQTLKDATTKGLMKITIE